MEKQINNNNNNNSIQYKSRCWLGQVRCITGVWGNEADTPVLGGGAGVGGAEEGVLGGVCVCALGCVGVCAWG